MRADSSQYFHIRSGPLIRAWFGEPSLRIIHATGAPSGVTKSACDVTNPNAKSTGFFANPAGPGGDQFAALGGQGISIVNYSNNKEEAFKFLQWFIKDETQKKWAELGGYTCNKAVLESAEFQNATPYNKAFYDTMFKVKDFWAVPEYAELLQQLNQRVYPTVIGGEMSSKDTLDALAADWTATFKKYGRIK